MLRDQLNVKGKFVEKKQIYDHTIIITWYKPNIVSIYNIL